MRLLYSFGISCYGLGVRLAAPFNEKAKLMVKGWRHAFEQLEAMPTDGCKTAWFHASSLGEFEQARPVLEQFRIENPGFRVCVTFFSPSGYEIRKNYAGADLVCYLPMDTRAHARRFVEMLHPDVAFFVKYDFWFNYLDQLSRRQVPTYIFSAIFRPNQYFFKWYGGWFLKQLRRCYTHLFVQNEESVRLLQNHGVGQCSVAGDTRFDRVHAITQESQPNEVVELFLSYHSGCKVLVAGSTWEPDETQLAEMADERKDVAFIVAPHVISEGHLTLITDLFAKKHGHKVVRYSQLREGQDADARILLIDNIGMLATLYRYADVAYIGGGFGVGIHNILEAVTFGKPVVFGPNYHKFKEACDIIALGGGFSYRDADELRRTMASLLDDESYRQASSQVCQHYLADNLGSTKLILNEIKIK